MRRCCSCTQDKLITLITKQYLGIVSDTSVRFFHLEFRLVTKSIGAGESENRGGTEIDSFNGTETFLVRGGTLAVYDALTPHWGEGVKVPQIRG